METSEHTQACCRCEEIIEGNAVLEDRQWAKIVLSQEEQVFIRSKFDAPLCAACLNQLKTSYKILKGYFNSPNKENIPR